VFVGHQYKKFAGNLMPPDSTLNMTALASSEALVANRLHGLT